MFYPVDSLKRGGRFYLCWVADSWPLRFAAITHRQLWSQDIRELCDDLLEVMTTESGRPNNRFSLRLSSQLMRGLVRLYERKVAVLLGDLCMINAYVFKTTNKKLVPHNERPLRKLPQLRAAEALVEEPEEQRVEELIQNSGNVVSNIQDITLKEAVIPEFQLPPNDNFGEENPDQAIQTLLADRTIEVMMQETSGAQISGLDLPVDNSTDKSTEKSRPMLKSPQMESIAELDVTLFRKSTAEGIPPPFEKEEPAVPEEPLPVPPAPEPILPKSPQMQVEQVPEEIPAPTPSVAATAQRKEVRQKPAAIELEELEEQPMAKRRRGRTSLIIDKKTKLGSNFLRARVDNPHVEMRFGDFSDAIIDPRPPAALLLRRPAHGASPLLGRLFQRNCGVAQGVPLADREQEVVKETEEPRKQRTRSKSTLEQIAEEEEPQPHMEARLLPPTQLEITRRATEGPEEAMITVEAPNITAEAMNMTRELTVTINRLNITDVPNVQQPDPNQMQVDISDLPTQKLEPLSQVARKRASGREVVDEAKRQRSVGYVSFKESQQQKSMQPPEIIVDEPDKENIPPNTQDQPFEPIIQQRTSQLEKSQDDAARLLQEAGLSDIQPAVGRPKEQIVQESQRKRRTGSEGTETPLGSLDRTKVSLEDSDKPTDSQRFIRNQWGIEGTMMKIIVAIKHGGLVTIQRLVSEGPLIPGYKNIITARCFISALNLKKHGFIRIVKDPDTLEIRDMRLGPRFDYM